MSQGPAPARSNVGAHACTREECKIMANALALRFRSPFEGRIELVKLGVAETVCAVVNAMGRVAS
jgi:hypothetical protein